MDLKADLSLFTHSGFDSYLGDAYSYAYVNGLLIQVLSGVMSTEITNMTLTFPIAFNSGYRAVYSQYQGSMTIDSHMTNNTLSSVDIVRTGDMDPVRFNVIAIGV